MPRGSGGRGLISIWDCFRAATSRVSHAMINSENELLKLCCSIDVKSLFSVATTYNRQPKLSLKAYVDVSIKTAITEMM